MTIPSFCDEKIDLFLARDLAGCASQLDFDEVIKVDRVDLKQALAMIASGEIVDAKSIVAMQHAQAFLNQGQK